MRGGIPRRRKCGNVNGTSPNQEVVMSVVSSEETYAAAGLEMPLILDGRHLSPPEQEALHHDMEEVFHRWGEESKIVRNPWMPWMTTGAEGLDAQSVASKIPAKTS